MRSLAAALERRRAQHLYRRRRIVESAQGPELCIDGRFLSSFCSNDYLGLANHPDVVRAFQQGASDYGVGAGAAHLVSGHNRAHHALEEELAAYLARPRALLFSTGYMANLGTITALLGRGDAVFEDRLNHASLIDAGLNCGARFRRYAHTDVSALEAMLATSGAATKLIVTDGVFSMDGDIAPLPELAAAARRHSAWLMVDDAHGFGVIGPGGRGSAAHFDLGRSDVPVLMGTLGKACGTFGAFVAGSEELIETLIQEARSYIYTTALPPAVAEATRASLRLLADDERRAHLRALIARFREGAQALGLTVMASHTPIQPLVVGEAERAVNLSAALFERGILVTAIRPPTVPAGTARLRITFTAAHTVTQVDQLLDALDQVI